jgi:GMP synthase (glutamine-hydrolysing)
VQAFVAVLCAGRPVPEVERRRGGFDALLTALCPEAWRSAFVGIDVTESAASLPSLSEVSALVVTGSAASVTERTAWMLRVEEYLKRAVEARLPVLGVCFGHQMLAQALGGRAAKNPRGREIGTVLFEPSEKDGVIGRAEPFAVNMTHVDSAVELPSGARVLGRTALEPHAAVRFAENAYGVQYHPELDGESMRLYIGARKAQLAFEGFDVEALTRSASDTPEAASVVARFAELVPSLDWARRVR